MNSTPESWTTRSSLRLKESASATIQPMIPTKTSAIKGWCNGCHPAARPKEGGLATGTCISVPYPEEQSATSQPLVGSFSHTSTTRERFRNEFPLISEDI